MKKGLYLLLSGVVVFITSSTLVAQDYEYHPAISDNFSAALGAMRSSNSFTFKAEGIGTPEDFEDDIDFDDALGVSHKSTFFNGQIRWKFGKARKWSLSGQYFSNDATGESVLTEDVEFDGVVFREGTFVGAGIDLAVTRLFIGRSFIKNEQNDFGAGIGLHNLDLETFIEGEIKVDDETTDFQRGEVDANQPLPNIGAWYLFSPAHKWLLHGRVDWISANIGDYDGTLWNFNAGVSYQAWRHVGFDLSWQYFNLDFKVDKSDWRGGAKMTYSGPVLAVTANW